MQSDVIAALTLCLMTGTTQSTLAQTTCVELAPPLAFEAQTGGSTLGFAIASGGDTVAISSRLADGNAVGSGIVYVFQMTDIGLTPVAELVDPQGMSNDLFGQEVAVSNDGDRIAVSAIFDDGTQSTNAGSVTVFDRVNGMWEFEARLEPSQPRTDGWFGTGIAIGQDTVIVGAREENSASRGNTGAVYEFQRLADGFWIGFDRLTPAELTSQDRFGHTVEVDGDTLAVGAFNHSLPGIRETGAVFVYERVGGFWVNPQILFGSSAGNDDFFGVTLALEGDRLAVGARLNTTGVDGSGAVYIFERENGVWTEAQRIANPSGSSASEFGSKVSLHGDLLLVGDWQHDDSAGDNRGRAYLFERGTQGFALTSTIEPPTEIDAEAYFGHDVELFGNTALIGAFGDTVSGLALAGSVLNYDLACNAECVADTNRDGMLTPADFNGWILAYNNRTGPCDQNRDSLCTPADFNGWILNFNDGCP